MTHSEFFKRYKGKKIDWDSQYGVQCVDLIDQYIVDVIGLKIGFYGNAKLWWQSRNSSDWLKKNFYFITPEFKAYETRRGDIGVRVSGTYGHVFVIDSVNENGNFSYYDQNGTGTGDAVTLRTKPYNSNYITGILRPKNQSNIDGAEVYGNGYMTQTAYVYSDSLLKNRIGTLYTGDRVCKLGTGNGRTMLCYPVDTYYKVGFIKSGYKAD